MFCKFAAGVGGFLTGSRRIGRGSVFDCDHPLERLAAEFFVVGLRSVPFCFRAPAEALDCARSEGAGRTAVLWFPEPRPIGVIALSRDRPNLRPRGLR